MSNQNDEKLMDHDYDGIKELDNDLPKWWIYIFYVTVIFSAIYGWYYYGGGPGESHVAVFEKEMAQDLTASKEAAAKISFDQKELEDLSKNNAVMTKGKEIYSLKCVACHMADGGGGVGPNLTDDYWIHGGNVAQIARTIHDGVLDKGMVAWGQLMSLDEVKAVAVYVKSLKGTHPANPKAPQGTKEL